MTAPKREGKLTKAQLKVLEAANNSRGLWQNDGNLWRWFKSLDNGMVIQVAGNSTVSVLRAKGLLQWNGATKVHITDAGRAVLSRSDK